VNTYRIPARLNVGIALAQIGIMLGIFRAAGQTTSWWVIALLSFGYGIVMNSGYAMLHEAEHGILHPNRGVNDFIGTVLALFFPAKAVSGNACSFTAPSPDSSGC
jgi:fatty acid desaturase